MHPHRDVFFISIYLLLKSLAIPTFYLHATQIFLSVFLSLFG
jgi:hypothetical protein